MIITDDTSQNSIQNAIAYDGLILLFLFAVIGEESQSEAWMSLTRPNKKKPSPPTTPL